ncbi:unnamed protein product [Rotaria socialis]|uniref:Uncharacterized protein n=2 Tax=Rotaria socialis TaxID=392032 RepID=A0A820A2P4_9BILA|nr:unnamed protein product [Rotaria socialis]
MTNNSSGAYPYVLEVDGKIYRLSVPQAYIQVKELKSTIRQRFSIFYKFKLTYKGAILEDDEKFIDLRLNTANSVRIRRDSTEPLSDQPYTEAPTVHLSKIQFNRPSPDRSHNNTNRNLDRHNDTNENKKRPKTAMVSHHDVGDSFALRAASVVGCSKTIIDDDNLANSKQPHPYNPCKRSCETIPLSEVEDLMDPQFLRPNAGIARSQSKSVYTGFATSISFSNTPVQSESDDDDFKSSQYTCKSSSYVHRETYSLPLSPVDDWTGKEQPRSISTKPQRSFRESPDRKLCDTVDASSRQARQSRRSSTSTSNDDDTDENTRNDNFLEVSNPGYRQITKVSTIRSRTSSVKSMSMHDRSSSSTSSISTDEDNEKDKYLRRKTVNKGFGLKPSDHHRSSVTTTEIRQTPTSVRAISNLEKSKNVVEDSASETDRRSPANQNQLLRTDASFTSTTDSLYQMERTPTVNSYKEKNKLTLNESQVNASCISDVRVTDPRARSVLEDEGCSEERHLLLLFTHRMHIFEKTNTDDELIGTFLRLMPSTSQSDNEKTIHFYAYTLKHKFRRDMYTYETDPKELFTHSEWWETCVCTPQVTVSQTMMLSTMYVLYQYFSRPVQEEIGKRVALEAQFLLQMRKYLFRPAVLALKHMMIGAMFVYEKKILIDSLLILLIKFRPKKIEESLAGIFIPYLICWMFHQCDLESEEEDSCVELGLVRHSDAFQSFYFNDPTTEAELTLNCVTLYEHQEIRNDNSIRHVDIFSLIKHLKNPCLYTFGRQCTAESYFIDLFKTNEKDPIKPITDIQVNEICDIMHHRYECFTLITREKLRNKFRDQLIMLKDRCVGIAFSRRQRVCSNNMIDYDVDAFGPTRDNEQKILNANDIYEVEPERPDPQLSSFISQIMQVKTMPTILNTRSVEQITMVLLDVSASMFRTHAHNNANLPTLFELSRAVLFILSDNLQWQTHPHAIGLILFGSQATIRCYPTQDPDTFEQEINQIPNFKNEYTHMYDALILALNTMDEYAKQYPVTSDCNQLIICISDGVDWGSKTTAREVKQRIKQSRKKTVMDLVSFVTDTRQLRNNNDRQRHLEARSLCQETDGNFYCNRFIEPADLAMTFEQETAWWVKARKRRNILERNAGAHRVDYPTQEPPDQLYATASRFQPQCRTADEPRILTAGSRRARIKNEANNVATSQMKGIHLFVSDVDINFWKIIFEGPPNTLYANCRWLLYVTFPDQYPSIPPNLRFYTRIYHVNISGDGRICHELLGTAWSTRVKMCKVLEALVNLLTEPNYSHPISPQKAALYHQNRENYKTRVLEWNNKYARKSIDDLCAEFNLR